MECDAEIDVRVHFTGSALLSIRRIRGLTHPARLVVMRLFFSNRIGARYTRIGKPLKPVLRCCSQGRAVKNR